MAFLTVATVGVVLLIFDVVAGRAAGVTATALAAVLLLGLWVVMPLIVRKRRRGQAATQLSQVNERNVESPDARRDAAPGDDCP